MSLKKYKEIASKYCVEDLPGALLPGTPISNVLKHLEAEEKVISNIAQNYLIRKGLLALLHYTKNELAFDEFSKVAKQEQFERCRLSEIKALQRQSTQKKQDEIRKQKNEVLQARLRKISKARAKGSRLRQKYELDYFIEKSDYPKLMSILRRIEKGVRLPEVDIIWLNSEGEEYFTQELREGFHRIEADFHAKIFRSKNDPWAAVNASSHYRKCKESENAESLLSMVDVLNLKNAQLQSAIYTTYGGVKRDLGKWSEALSLGEEAHKLTPKDFWPCTLLGAVNMETGNFSAGQLWYEKAVERGYREDSVDNELRAIFMRAETSQKKALRVHLLGIDPKRYSWVNRQSNKNKKFITNQST
ncbi:tetratricopeptide repeat protein [Desulfobacter postgatei]|uniref:Uncharacterized protein n=1 Tax=Desulfobacter postgatei 2ac9 TaxID=879212 RepID=I5B4W4_9BACT|nr:hypothetical protein [Desulfobacter postgatei]EIM64527.1 hypothetical protein DespoDRAFT_02691 [Desulfobacter postgatei 2ac9]